MPRSKVEKFEAILDATVEQLGKDVRAGTKHHNAKAFEKRVLEVLRISSAGTDFDVQPSFHPHAFPDINVSGFGVEVKSTIKDSWLSVGNSVFEGMREESVKKIYLVFGKMGGMPGVRWGRYEERVTHVRISHAPRFVIEMDRDASLFKKMDVSYDDFSKLDPIEKMEYIRRYSRGRLQPGERLWWLEDETSEGIPVEIKLYMSLTKAEKIKLRAEGAVLFPKIVGGSRVRDKYEDIAFYALKHRNIFCPQTRDLYSAGSVAGKERGGNYIQRALIRIQEPMKEAFLALNDELFQEYWGKVVQPDNRIKEWLKMADAHAKDWVPSEHLFLDG